MRKYLNLYFVIIALAGLMSCNRNVSCPKFDEKILSWIPYQESDVIELYSPMNDSTITFSIESVEIRHTTHYNTGYDCGTCDDAITINYHNSKFYIDIALNKNKITSQRYQLIDSYFTDYNITYTELTNFSFENKVYDAVRIFEKNDSIGTFKKLIIAKEIGIVGIVDIYGNTWSLKNSVGLNKGFSERENIKINNVSCD